MDESDVPEFIQILKSWKSSENNKPVKDVLLHCQKISSEFAEPILNNLVDQLTAFHKEINKSSKEDKVDETWFKDVQAAKKHIRKILDEKKKEQALLKQPKLIKSSSEIKFPEEIAKAELVGRELQFVKMLYKNFLLHLEESI